MITINNTTTYLSIVDSNGQELYVAKNSTILEFDVAITVRDSNSATDSNKVFTIDDIADVAAINDPAVVPVPANLGLLKDLLVTYLFA